MCWKHKRDKDMAKSKKIRDCIMLNKMYVGTYLSSKNNNIGHEVINLLQTDEGENYISAMPYSTIGKTRIGKIGTVLLVRSHGIRTLEILAKAEIEKEVINENNEFKYSFQEEYIKGMHDEDKHKKITYGGKYLHKIYAENNNYGNGKGSLITFKVKKDGLKKVVKNKRLFITVDDNLPKDQQDSKDKIEFVLINQDKNFPPRNKPIYYSNGDKGYDELINLINNREDLWEETNTTRKIDKNYIAELLKNEKYSMIDILDKKDAENTYSNFFYHFFETNHKLFQEFAKDILGIKNFSNTFTIAREEAARIDLLIYDDKNVIVIENKIKSDINGKKHDENDNITTQLDKYYEYVTEQPKESGEDSKEKIGEWKNKFGTKDKKFYIFAPKYNKLASEEKIILPRYYPTNKNAYYTVISYDKLFDFFDRDDIKKEYESRRYYPEFLYALEKHIEPIDNHYEKEILKRFVKVIKCMS